MAVHNGQRTLARALESVLGQTAPEFELLVIDDGSTDGSAKIVSSYRDRRIRLERNEKNLGLTRSLNRGLSLIETEYVARLDADDISLPRRLERQTAYLDAHPEVAVVGCQGTPIDTRGRRIRRAEWWHREWQRPRGGIEMEWYRTFDTPLIHSSAMFRRAVIWDALGGYDERCLLEQDAELWARAAAFGVENLDERLVEMRLSATSMTADRGRPERVGYRTRKAALVTSLLRDTLGWPDAPRDLPTAWVDVQDPGASLTSSQIRALRSGLHECASRFAAIHPEVRRSRFIRRHRGSMAVRLAEKCASVDRLLMLTLLIDAFRLDPIGTARCGPRLLLLMAGDAPLQRWRHVRRQRELREIS